MDRGNVEVYVRRKCLGWFQPGVVGLSRACVSYERAGEKETVGGVYIRPKMLRAEWCERKADLEDAEVVFGDFKARHGDWDKAGWNIKGDWTREYFAERSMTVYPAGGATF